MTRRRAPYAQRGLRGACRPRESESNFTTGSGKDWVIEEQSRCQKPAVMPGALIGSTRNYAACLRIACWVDRGPISCSALGKMEFAANYIHNGHYSLCGYSLASQNMSCTIEASTQMLESKQPVPLISMYCFTVPDSWTCSLHFRLFVHLMERPVGALDRFYDSY